MRRFRRFLWTSLLILAFASTGEVSAHHSWKCPPVIDVKVVGVDDDTFTLQVTARNTCGCKIKFKACPIGLKGECVASDGWIPPGGYFHGTVKTGPSGTAEYDWGTHSNDAPCT